MVDAAGTDDGGALAVLDDEGTQVVLDEDDATMLFALTGDLEPATISSCPGCRSRVLACLALVDLLDGSGPHPRSEELIALADDAPSSHCYVQDLASGCRHRRWLDPGRLEWLDVVVASGAAARPRH